jgi:hypothetical protein
VNYVRLGLFAVADEETFNCFRFELTLFSIWNMCESFGAEDLEMGYFWLLGMPNVIRRYCYVMMKRPIKGVNCKVDCGSP